MTQSLPDMAMRVLARRRPGRMPEQPPRTTRRRGAAALSGVPLFAGLPKRALARLAAEADEVTFDPGERIVEEGMLGETLYVLLEGQAKVLVAGRTVRRALPGEFIGELSVLDGGPRSATVVPETPVVALRLFRHTLVDLLRREPSVSLRILAGIARRIRETERPISG
jgi:CRP-like cAMP-binding protein